MGRQPGDDQARAKDGRGSCQRHLHDARDRRWPFLVIDEVTPDNDKWGPAANALINLLSARTGRWTLLTSNLGIAEMEHLDPRISSRLIRDGSKVVIVDTQDYSTRR